MNLVEALASPPRVDKEPPAKPKILCWDIENSPAKGYFWGPTYNTNIIRVIEPSAVICFAAKWLGEGDVEFWSDFHDGHEVMMDRAWELIHEADALVSYNGVGHDTPHIMTEFKLAGYCPPSPFKEIDLYRVVRKNFKFQQNKLAFVAEQLQIGSKLHNDGLDLWLRCEAGDPDAWADMKEYNIQDTLLLEDAYYDILPWIPQSMIPHAGLYAGLENVCGRCGSTDLALDEDKFYGTSVSAFRLFHCQSCGGWSRGKKNVGSVDARAV